MKRWLITVLMLVEPVCHAFGIPHPEGLSELAINWLASES